VNLFLNSRNMLEKNGSGGMKGILTFYLEF